MSPQQIRLLEYLYECEHYVVLTSPVDRGIAVDLEKRGFVESMVWARTEWRISAKGRLLVEAGRAA